MPSALKQTDFIIPHIEKLQPTNFAPWHWLHTLYYISSFSYSYIYEALSSTLSFLIIKLASVVKNFHLEIPL